MATSRALGRMILVGCALLIIVTSSLVQAQPRRGGELVLVSAVEPDTLDAHKTSSAISADLMRYFGDTLITKDLQGDYTAGLAQSWNVSRDGLTWSFQLRQGVRFHDGTPLTAQAVKASVDRAVAPETKSPTAGVLFGPVASVQASGDLAVVIRLKEPFSPFIDDLAYPMTMVVSPQAVQQLGDRFGRSPVGTGPFKFQEWRSADRIVLVRNPDYQWGPRHVQAGPAYIERLVLRIMPESAAQVAAFERAELSILTVPPTDVRRLQSSGKYTFHTFLQKGVVFIIFNVTKEPFNDLRVRRAFNFAIEKKSLLQIGLEGLGEIAHGPLPPSIWGYWDGVTDYAPGYDPGQAKRLLADAGWQPGAGGVLHKDGKPFSFVLNIVPFDTSRRAAQIVQSQLRAFGIQMEIQTFEFGTALAKLRAGEHQAALAGYIYNSPNVVHAWFHSSNVGTGLAFGHYKDPALDKMIEASRTLQSPQRRLEMYRDIQKFIIDKALWVPLFIPTHYIAIQPNVQGAKIHPDGVVMLNDAFLR